MDRKHGDKKNSRYSTLQYEALRVSEVVGCPCLRPSAVAFSFAEFQSPRRTASHSSSINFSSASVASSNFATNVGSTAAWTVCFAVVPLRAGLASDLLEASEGSCRGLCIRKERQARPLPVKLVGPERKCPAGGWKMNRPEKRKIL